MTSPFRGSRSDVPYSTLRGPQYEQLGHDVYVLRSAELTLRTRVDAALTVFPEAVPCLWTGAALLNLPVDDDGIVHLDRGKGASRSRRAGVKVHRYGIPDERIHDLDGLRVADGPRCFADLSAHLDLEGLVALGDVVARRWEDAEIEAAVSDHGCRPGAVLLQHALPLLDKRSDSPAESRARLRLHAAGFTGLVHGTVVRDVGGGWLSEPDLGDEVAKVAYQHEGEVHFLKGVKQRRHDVDRDDLSRAESWEVVVGTALDDAQPHRLIERIEAAYRRAAQKWGPQVLPAHMR